MANEVKVKISGKEDVSGAAAAAAAAIDALKDKKITVKVDFDTKDAEKAIDDLNNNAKKIGKDAKFNIDTKDAKNKLDALYNRAKKLGDLASKFDIDTSKGDAKLDRLIDKKNQISEDTKISLDAGPANSKLDRLIDKKNKIGDKNNATKIQLDAGPANSKVDRLLEKISRISDKDNAHKIELDAGPANSKLDRLLNKAAGLTNDPIKVEIDTDSARSKLEELSNYSKNINIDVDVDRLAEDIEDIVLALDGLEDKTINIDVDAAGAIAEIQALDALLNGFDPNKNVDVGVDVDNIQLELLKSELDALYARRDRVEVDVDFDRIKELEDRIAANKESAVTFAGLKDKDVVISVTVNGLSRLEMLHRMIQQINDKTVTVTVNSNQRGMKNVSRDIKDIDKKVSKPVVKPVKVDLDNSEIDRKIFERTNIFQRFTRELADAMNQKFDLTQFDDRKLDSYKRKLDRINRGLAPRMAHEENNKEWINQFEKDIAAIEAKPIHLRTTYDKNMLQELKQGLKEINAIQSKRIAENDRAIVKRDDLNSKIKDIENERRYIIIRADADIAAAEAKLKALTRTRTAKINTDVDSESAGRVRSFINQSTSGISRIRQGFGRAFDDDRSLVRAGRTTARVFNGIGDTLSSVVTPLFKGLGLITSRIPVVGGLMKGIAGIGNPFAQAAAGAATLGIASTVASGIAVVGIGAVYAALGAVAGIAGVAGSAIGAGFIAGFASIAAQSEQVKTAFSDMGSYVGDAMKVIAQPVELPLVRAATALKGAFDLMRPSLDRIAVGTGQLIDNLSGKLPAIAQALGPALEKTFDAGSKHLIQFANRLPGIIDGVGEFMSKLGSEKTLAGADRFFQRLPGLISGAGSAIEGLASGFVKMDDYFQSGAFDPMLKGLSDFKNNLQNTDFSGLISGITDMGNSFGDALGQMNTQAVSDFIGDIASGMGQLTEATAQVVSGFAEINGAATGFRDSVNEAFNFNEALAEQGDFSFWDRVKMNMSGKPVSLVDEDISNSINQWLDDVGLIEWDGPEVKANPQFNLGEDGKPFEIPETQIPDSELTVPVSMIPEVISAEGFEGIADVLGDIKDLPPIEKVQEIVAIMQLADSGQLNGEQLSGIIERVGGIGDLPPVEKLQLINLVYKLLNEGDITLDQANEILGPAGLPPIDAEQVVNIKTQLGSVIGLDAASYKLESELKSLAQPGGAPVEITQDALLKINPDAKAAEDQIRAFLGTLTGLAPQDVDLNITARPVLAIPNLEGALRTATMNVGPISAETLINVQGALGKVVGVPPGEIVSRLQSLAASNGGVAQIPVTADIIAEIGQMTGLDAGAVEGMLESLLGGLSNSTVDVVVDVNATMGSVLGVDPASVTTKIKELAGAGGTAQIEVTADIIAKLGAATGMDPGAVEAMIESMYSNENVTVDVIVTPNPIIENNGGPQGLFGKFGNTPASNTIKIPVEPDFVGFDLALSNAGTGTSPIKIPVIPDLTGFAAVMGAIGGSSVGIVKVLVQPDLSGFGAILGAINGSTIGTVKVLVIPDLSAMGALGAITIPPIRVPVIVDPPIMPVIPTPPAIRIPSVIEVPAMPSIPNTTSTHTVQVNAQPLPSYPNTTSTHTVIMNAPASTPSYPNTSSTHTVNIVVNGSLPGAGGGAARSAAMGISNEIGALARGIGPMGASIPMAAPSMSGGGRGIAKLYGTGKAISQSIANGLLAGRSFIDKAVDEIGVAISNVGTEMDKILSANVPGYDAAKSQAQDFVNGFNQTLSGISEAAGFAGAELQKVVAEEFVLPPMDKIISKAQEIGDGIGAALTGDPTKLATTMDGIGSALATKVTNIQAKVGSAMTGVNQILIDKVPGYAQMQAKGVEIGSGLQAGIANTQAGLSTLAANIGTNINNSLAALNIQTPAPLVPAPNTTALDQAVNAIGSIVPPDIIATMMPDFESLLKITEKEIPAIADQIEAIIVDIGANPEALAGALNSIADLAPELALPVTPDLAGLAQGLGAALPALPPIQIPAIPDTTALMAGFAGIVPPPIVAPVTLTPPALPVINIPPVIAPVSFQIPAMPTFPNTSSTHTISVSMGAVPTIPDTASVHNVSVNAAPAPSYPDTSSTHTVNVVVVGNKGIPGAVKSGGFSSAAPLLSRGSSAMGAPVTNISRTMGAAAPTVPRGTGLGLTVGALALGGIFLGFAGILSTLFSIFSGFTKRLGQLQPGDVDGGSYRPDGVINHYYYQTINQNNNFDGGLVGDPELQGKRVLEVLEATPNGRRFRNQQGAST